MRPRFALHPSRVAWVSINANPIESAFANLPGPLRDRASRQYLQRRPIPLSSRQYTHACQYFDQPSSHLITNAVTSPPDPPPPAIVKKVGCGNTSFLQKVMPLLSTCCCLAPSPTSSISSTFPLHITNGKQEFHHERSKWNGMGVSRTNISPSKLNTHPNSHGSACCTYSSPIAMTHTSSSRGMKSSGPLLSDSASTVQPSIPRRAVHTIPITKEGNQLIGNNDTQEECENTLSSSEQSILTSPSLTLTQLQEVAEMNEALTAMAIKHHTETILERLRLQLLRSGTGSKIRVRSRAYLLSISFGFNSSLHFVIYSHYTSLSFSLFLFLILSGTTWPPFMLQSAFTLMRVPLFSAHGHEAFHYR